MEVIAVIGVPVAFMVLMGILMRRQQRKLWGGGHCGCGGIWRSFDMDSGGATGYKCDACRDVIWLDWFTPEREIDAMGLLR